MKIGIIKEGKTPPDKRVPLNPEQCKRLIEGHPEIELVVQTSNIRAFSDDDYREMGIKIVDDVSDCDVLLGVKEVPKPDLIPNKTYFYFSHTYKEQPYNAKLLKTMLDKKIQMVDYELLKDASGRRLIGFGRYAGVVGTYNAFRAWGEKFKSFKLKAAHQCFDRAEMEKELHQVNLPTNFKMVMSGHGRVGHGALEILALLDIKPVSPEEFLANDYDYPVYTHIDSHDYNMREDGAAFNKQHFYAHPEMYVSDFYRFARVASMYIPCHYWDADAPLILTKEDYRKEDFKIILISDISCDITVPIASTIRPSTISDPFYGYDSATGKEVDFYDDSAIGITAVDNLPCELPRDASTDFGNVMLEKILPVLIGKDEDRIIERASETSLEGELMPDFDYLEDYVKGAS